MSTSTSRLVSGSNPDPIKYATSFIGLPIIKDCQSFAGEQESGRCGSLA